MFYYKGRNLAAITGEILLNRLQLIPLFLAANSGGKAGSSKPSKTNPVLKAVFNKICRGR
jgi:hypothetical protein